MITNLAISVRAILFFIYVSISKKAANIAFFGKITYFNCGIFATRRKEVVNSSNCSQGRSQAIAW